MPNEHDDERVRACTCSVAEGPQMRAMLEAHGIAATVVGGGPYASFSVDVWVAKRDAEEAAALLAELHAAPDPSSDSDGDGDGDADADADADSSASIEYRIQRKRQVGVAILLACFITFGTAHLFARAWLRAIALAALEIYGIRTAVHGDPRLGVVMIGAAIVVDAIGSVIVLRARFGRAPLPIARAR